MYDDPPADLPSGLSARILTIQSPPPRPNSRARSLPLGDHATTDRVCPFLRVVAEDGTPGPAIENPDPTNRCVAMHEPVPQSLRQQELVCLSSAHVNCPRYLRGSVGLVAAPVERVAPTRTVTAATGAALALFGLAFVVSIGFVVATGGLALTAATATSSPTARSLARSRRPRQAPS